jgi:hypothetical protein
MQATKTQVHCTVQCTCVFVACILDCSSNRCHPRKEKEVKMGFLSAPVAGFTAVPQRTLLVFDGVSKLLGHQASILHRRQSQPDQFLLSRAEEPHIKQHTSTQSCKVFTTT